MSKRFSPFVLGVVALLSVPVATVGAQDASTAAAVHAATPEPGNLLLVTLDTTRADHIGAWGWPHAHTPTLDALAARGTRFARCDTAAPITLPSHATIFTGLLPPRHGVRDNAIFTLGDDVPIVTQILADAGYDAGAVVSAAVLARHHGLARGFRIYDDELPSPAGGGVATAERRADATTDAALGLVARLERPYFLWVHYFDPHDRYTPPAVHRAQVDGPHADYDGEIAFVDAQLGRLLGAVGEEASVVVVGDHGEMLGDGGEPTHGLLLGPGARRVPLIVAGSGVPRGRVVDCLVRTADVMPTLLGLAEVPVPPGLDGHDLLPVPTAAGECDRTSYTESFLPFFAHGWYPPRSISDGRWRYRHGPRPGLWDLAADPRETDDLAPERGAEVAAWAGRLSALVEAMGEPLEDATVAQARTIGVEERARLESLGYLGGGSGGGTVGRDLPDVRDRLDVARGLHEAAMLVADGRCDEALPRLQAVLREDPNNVPALNQSGLCLMGAGRWQSALNAFQRAAQRNPQLAVPVLNAAHCLLQLGRLRDAEDSYAHALALDPTAPGAAANVARLLRERGETARATEVIARAFEAGGHHPGLYVERGLQRAASGDVGLALADFEAAVDRAPDDPVARENAARAAALAGRPAVAVAHWRALLARFPERPDWWAALAEVYLGGLGDVEGARSALDRAIEVEPDPGRKRRLETYRAQLGSP